MSNGCVCCTIREDLRSTLADLAEKRRKGELHFDRVVIETTGLADPGPVAQTFFMDDEIAESYLLDSILTLVDAKHADGSSTRARRRAARWALPTRSSSARPTWWPRPRSTPWCTASST
jgi:G3E family GTPase